MIEWIKSRLTGGCLCTSRVVERAQPDWNSGRDLYGYGVVVTVRVHTGKCQFHDEVLDARAIKVR